MSHRTWMIKETAKIACVVGVGLLVSTALPAASEWAEGSKFNSGVDKTEKDGKCKGKAENCYTGVALGGCQNFTPAKTCPLCSNTANSGRLIELTEWGTCDTGKSGDKCDQYAYFYCAKMDWFAEAGCPAGSGATCTVAYGKADACDPEPNQ